MKRRPLVLLGDEIATFGVMRLQRAFDVEMMPADNEVESRHRLLPIAEAIVVRRFEVTEALLKQMPRLKLIAKHGAGVDNIDVAAASARGILVTNTPGANAEAVAEGAMALILAASRRLREGDLSVRAGKYDEGRRLTTHQIGGRCLGLIGFGQIARHLARIAQNGFLMPVLAFDPQVDAETMATAGTTKTHSLPELLEQADILSIHVPLDDTTRNLIGAREISLMKPTAIVVNTARGGIVDENALAQALREGRLAGAGLDVFASEPPSSDDPLFALSNVVASPHIAGVTVESLRNMAEQVVQAVEDVFAGIRPTSMVNPQSWRPL